MRPNLTRPTETSVCADSLFRVAYRIFSKGGGGGGIVEDFISLIPRPLAPGKVPGTCTHRLAMHVQDYHIKVSVHYNLPCGTLISSSNGSVEYVTILNKFLLYIGKI